MDIKAAVREIVAFFVKNKRGMTDSELGAIVGKYTANDEEVKILHRYLSSDAGKTAIKKELKDREDISWKLKLPSSEEAIRRFLATPDDQLLRIGLPEEVRNKLVNEAHLLPDYVSRMSIKEAKQELETLLGKNLKSIPEGAANPKFKPVPEDVRKAMGGASKEESLPESIARQLGLRYEGVQKGLKDEFRGYIFTDLVTGTSIMCWDLDSCKKTLNEKRKLFGEKSYLRESDRLLPFADYAAGTGRWTGIFGDKKITVTIKDLIATRKNLEQSQAIVQNAKSKEDIVFSGAGGDDAWWQQWSQNQNYVVQLTGIQGISSMHGTSREAIMESMFNNSVAAIKVEPISYLKEDESCQIMPPEYYWLLPILGTIPSASFLVEPEAKGRKIDEILKRLKEGVESISGSAVFREYLVTMAKFYNYSIGNQILIMLQRKNATRVAGFNTWKDLGRYVKGGEKGIAILAPCMPAKPKPVEGEEEEESETAPRPHYFKVVYVFDVSQTEGKPLPEVEVKPLSGAADEVLFTKVMALLKKQGVAVSFESKPDQDPGIKGYFMGKSIWVRPEESRAQQLKTLIHETGHYYTESVFGIPRADAETIAESVAFTVGAHFGYDSGTYSFPYVAVWAKDKKVLERNLASIQKISTRIIEAV